MKISIFSLFYAKMYESIKKAEKNLPHGLAAEKEIFWKVCIPIYCFV